jgi:heme/copper-type cytochrome/quinol oxidase subunit 2
MNWNKCCILIIVVVVVVVVVVVAAATVWKERERETSSFYWAHLNRFRLKTETECSLKNVF